MVGAETGCALKLDAAAGDHDAVGGDAGCPIVLYVDSMRHEPHGRCGVSAGRYYESAARVREHVRACSRAVAS